MRTSHRLDVVVVPSRADDTVDAAAQALLDALRAQDVITHQGSPGPHSERWMPGTFGRLHLDVPGVVTLYANRQGGFRALCPVTGRNVTGAFVGAVTAFRAGGERVLACPSCGSSHALDDVRGAPSFAFGALAVVTAAATGNALSPWALELLEAALGPFRVVLRRG